MTCSHNPTGVLLERSALDKLVSITKDKGCFLLVDETYREMSYGTQLPIAATLGDHVISVSSMSKSYGTPRLRLGWIITSNKALQNTFLAAKEQICITSSVIDEWLAEEILARKEDILSEVRTEMAYRRDLVEVWIEKEDLVEWVRPEGGVVCFIHVKKGPGAGMKAFYDRLLTNYSTYVGPGHWFEMHDTPPRVGYGYTTREQLEDGLSNISRCLRDFE